MDAIALASRQDLPRLLDVLGIDVRRRRPGRTPASRVAAPDPEPAPTADEGSATRSLLAVYTAASIAAGLAALAWTTARVPVWTQIDPGLRGTVLTGPDGGLLLWIALGFVGSLRVLPIPGSSGAWTFHFPFVAAAMVLGGPTAGAWVGLLSTLERRELETQPWYGALANHSVMAFAAVAGGLTVEIVRGALLGAGADAGASGLIATATGTFVLAFGTSGLAAGTIMLRDRLSARELFDIVIRSFGGMTVAEIGIAWVFVVTFTAVGWWAPLVVAVAVLVLWPEPGKVDFLDPLTKLMRLKPFEYALDRALARSRRGLAAGGTLVSFDLVDFGEINKQIGFDAANDVLAEIGSRIRSSIRQATDLASRFGGDEFGVFLGGVTDRLTAMRLAAKLEAAICQPIVTSRGVVSVGVSIGVVVVPASSEIPSRITLMHWADRAMQHAKAEHRRDPRLPSIELHPYGVGDRTDGGTRRRG